MAAILGITGAIIDVEPFKREHLGTFPPAPHPDLSGAAPAPAPDPKPEPVEPTTPAPNPWPLPAGVVSQLEASLSRPVTSDQRPPTPDPRTATEPLALPLPVFQKLVAAGLFDPTGQPRPGALTRSQKELIARLLTPDEQRALLVKVRRHP